jgi:hypothetical protein
MQMIDPQTWRDSGGDDGQGHYEGDYRAEQIHAEIESWKEIGELIETIRFKQSANYAEAQRG